MALGLMRMEERRSLGLELASLPFSAQGIGVRHVVYSPRLLVLSRG